jgi:putative DNA primase/helicase
MTGARFVSAAESGVFKTIDDALIKDITGGKKVRARFLHKEHFEFAPQMKIWLATNHKPNIHDDSNGMWRRVRLIPFTITIPPEEQDKKLYYKLLDEAPGILNWCLEGFKQWQENGLGRCRLVEEATEEYQEAMDVMGRFTYDCLKLGENFQVKSSALYDCFTEWCRKNGERPWQHTTFSIKFADKGYKKLRKKDGQYWQGVDLNLEF